MQVELSFGRTGLPVELPDGYDYRLLSCPQTAPLADPVRAIEEALARASFAELARGKRTAAISVCDITRPAPNPIVLPPLIRALEAAGIARSEIRIMIATGLHRAATDAEIRQIVGPETYGSIEVLNHDARSQTQHRYLGETQSGTAVWIDERFLEADLHLSLGFIEPHLMLVYSGGRKLIAPGLAAEATIKRLHSP